jgi:hypothetical protein
MASVDFLGRECHELFSSYPLAVSPVNRSGTLQSMIVMLRESGSTEFFVLYRDYNGDQSFYSLFPWPSEMGADIETGQLDPPDVAVKVLTWGIPIPRHGSLWGWTGPGHVAALVAVYAKCAPASPEPYWTVMPLAGSPEAQWPPFTGEHDFGEWFWKHHRAGNISSLRSLIAATTDAVFWADTKAVLGSDCCAVARDLRSPEGYVLPSGRYVYYEALRAGKPVPSLQTLLTATEKIDLATRFQQYGPGDD